MNINYVSKNYKISDRFKEILEKKLSKLEKYFSKSYEIKVNCSQIGDMDKLEITINADGLFVRSEVLSDNMYNNIDLSMPKIEKQIVKASTKTRSKLFKEISNSSELEFLNEIPNDKPLKVVKSKRFELEPLTLDDAENNLEALGHSFYVFLNAKSGCVNVIYKRNDGDLGLIEVDF